MAKTRPEVTELPAQNVGFLFGTMMDLRMLPSELKHTGKVGKGEFKIVAHFPAKHAQDGTEAAYLARHRTFRGGLYATYQDGPYKIDEINWDATNRAGVHLVTETKYGQVVEFPTQPSKSMPGSLKLMVQEYVESLKVPGFVIRCSGLGGALEPKKGTTDEYDLVLLNGDVKCPKKLANHVPAKYHAEDESIFLAQAGPYSYNAEDLSDREQEYLGNAIAAAMKGYYRTGVIGTDPVIPAFPKGPMSIARRSDAAKQDFFREPAVQDRDGFWNKGPNRWQAQKIAQAMGYQALERAQSRGMFDAEEFAAVSTARPDLKREKQNVVNAVKDAYDNSFSWSACRWGPYFVRYQAEGSNKFYSVWVWERSPGVYTAMGAYGGLGQNPRLFNVGQTRDLQQAVNMAQKKLTAKQKKGYHTYSAEEMARLGDSDFPVVPNTGGGNTALGSGHGVPQWYGAEYFESPYAGKSALSDVGLSTDQLTATVGSGTFDEASLNSSGHMNVFANAEEFEAPMPRFPPSRKDVDKVVAAIKQRFKGVRVNGRPTYITDTSGGANKYHVFVRTNKGNFNGYGRIGHTMTLYGPMGDAQFESKMRQKMRKGYKETGY